MVVDDIAIMREGVRAQLAQTGLPLRVACEAGSAEEALAKLNDCAVDLVITDIRMGIKSGLELIEQAKSERSSLQFIILTGYAEFPYARDAVRLDVVDFLLKPLKTEELRDAVRKAMQRIGERQDRTLPAFRLPDINLKTDESGELVEKIKEYIVSRITQEITREEIAREFAFHPNYLSTWFKEKTGMTLLEMIHKLKIEAAEQLLETTSYPIGHVASLMGMEHSYFCKLFRKVNGKSPAEFRSELKNAAGKR
jgi:YesN/AraC family two-component response regulator